MRPGDITCPYVSPGGQNCEAVPGEECRWPDWTGKDAPPEYHEERSALAASMDRNAKPVSVEAFERAVEMDGEV